MPASAAMALHSSLSCSSQYPTPTPTPTPSLNSQQQMNTTQLAPKPKSLLHNHPLYAPAHKNISFQIKEKILCLELMGVDSGKALSQNPSIHTASLSSIHTIISYLQSKGIYQKDLPRILGMCPQILTSNIKTDLNPVFTFLSQDLKVPDNNFRRVINKCPRFLVSSVRDQLKPCLFYLRRLGFKDLEALAYKDSILLVSNVEKTLIPKLKYLESIGFSKNEAAGMLLRCPCLFTFSVENNFKPKFDYFIDEIQGKLEELKEFPQYFAFSLEKRIKPRHMEVVQSGVNVPLSMMLKSTDQEFEMLISSVGPSSPALQANIGGVERSSRGYIGKAVSLTNSAGGSALGSSKPSCRPWERGDLLRRLATFKPSNWLAKPKAACSLACAQRGWVNSDVDEISCESCGASLSFVLSSSLTPADVENAGEAFAKQLDVGHRVNCPWMGNSCPESLVQFPPTPQSALIGGYKDRCDGLLQFHVLPVVAASAVEHMLVFRGPMVDRFLSQAQNFSVEGELKSELIPEFESSRDAMLYSRAQKLISLCGWEPRWLPNVQDCEEHSAQSARNGCSFASAHAQVLRSHVPGPSMKAHSASAKRDIGKDKVIAMESRSDSRSPLLDCSLCGATVRVLDFLTVQRPPRFASNNIVIPDAGKKLTLTRGVSAASGINGWFAADDTEREHTEERDEVATTDEGKFVNAEVDLNLTMAGGLSFTMVDRASIPENVHDTDMGRDLMIGQPSGSEVGDRAASFESRGPSSRKRSLEIGGSSDDRLHLIQPADSIEGTVIDRDGDEVTDEKQFPAGPSKRARESDFFDNYCPPYQRESSGAGPSHSVGVGIHVDGQRTGPFRQGSDHFGGIPSAIDSTRASSVIAMDTICHSVDDDSMESVENVPGDIDEANFPSSSTYGNLDLNETSELNNSNQAQQSICFQAAAEIVTGEMGVSSTNDGEEIFNAENVMAQARDGLSFGISAGSVGMCASHEAEIHGADVSVHKADSIVGDVEPRIEDAENLGQTGESAPGPGVMDEIIPDEINREDPHGDSHEMMYQSVGRADSGSKIDGSAKAESVESGEKASRSCKLAHDNDATPSLSCNARMFSGCDTTKEEVAKAGPLKGESNYEEAVAFDPIIHHNEFCPWVNGNVAAAGCNSCSSSYNADADALCGWQLTLDALDALRSQGNLTNHPAHSESAASLYKDDHAPGDKLLRRRSFTRNHGQH